jgi:thiazole synthase
MAKIVSAMGISQIKIEIMAESKTLFPDPIETVKAVEMIRKDSSLANLNLFVYCSDDPILSLKLFEAGTDCIMPAGSAIGSGRGLANTANLKMIRNLLPNGFPLIIDAGIGTASDAAMAMELGYDAVLLNSAIALARDPLQMAEAMKLAVIAGRRAYLAGRIPEKLYATATSPQTRFSK